MEFQSIQNELLKFDSRLCMYLKNLDPDVVSLLKPFLIDKGKRIRPSLVYLVAGTSHSDLTDRTHKFAVVTELIHTASLFHDDVIDNADIRRQMPTPSNLHGNDLAVLAGDLLYIHALSILDDEPLDIRKAVHNTVTAMTQAEILQGLTRYKLISKTDYFRIIEGKTARLIALSCYLGASLQPDNALREKFRSFGLKLGLAFQIIDDLLDWTGSTKTGKNRFQDIKEGRVTLPVLSLLNQCNNQEKKAIESIMTDPALCSSEESISYCLDKMKSLGIENEIRSYASQTINEDFSSLRDKLHSNYLDDLLKIPALVANRRK